MFKLIPLLYGVFSRHLGKVNYLVAGWAITATASGIWGLVQFYLKYQHSKFTGEDFYSSYLGARITGFESHWMTFSALQLSVLLLLLAHSFFSDRRLPRWAYFDILILSVAILFAWTRRSGLPPCPRHCICSGSGNRK